GADDDADRQIDDVALEGELLELVEQRRRLFPDVEPGQSLHGAHEVASRGGRPRRRATGQQLGCRNTHPPVTRPGLPLHPVRRWGAWRTACDVAPARYAAI